MCIKYSQFFWAESFCSSLLNTFDILFCLFQSFIKLLNFCLRIALFFLNHDIRRFKLVNFRNGYSGARSNPEVIAPLDRLQRLIQPAAFPTDRLYLETRVKGKDLYVALRAAEHSIDRVR